MSKNDTELAAFIADITSIVVKKVLTELNLLKPFISMHAACNQYGRADVERWISEGLIKKERDADGKRWRISQIELETVSAASNRHSFLNNQ